MSSPTMEQKNRAFLTEYDPALVRAWDRMQGKVLTPTPARKGGVTLTFQGQWVHSRYDPAKEAQKACAGPSRPVHLHLGFGLGWFTAADQLEEGHQLVVFEPVPTLFLTAVTHIDLSELLPAKRARLVLDEEQLNEALREAGLREVGQLKIVWSPFHRRHVQHMETWLEKFLNELFRDIRISRKTLARLMPTFTRSSLRSLPHAYDKAPVDVLAGRFTGLAAVVVAPGPSLERNLVEMLPFRDRCLIFAVARSVRMLERLGIEPDFLVHNEAQDFYSSIHGCRNLSRTVFLLADQAHFAFFQAAPQLTFLYFNPTNFVWGWLEAAFPGRERSFLETGGSVANEAFSLALLFGCRAVALLGQDLAVGRTFYADAEVNRDFEHGRQDEAWVPAYFGGRVKTMQNYFHFFKWYENRTHRLRREQCPTVLVNATEGGACLPGFTNWKFRRYLETFAKKKKGDVSAVCQAHACDERAPSADQMKALVEKTLQEMSMVRDLCSQFSPFETQLSALLQNPDPQALQRLNVQLQTLDQFSQAVGSVVLKRLPLINGFIQKELQETEPPTRQPEQGGDPAEEIQRLLASIGEDVAHLKRTYQLIAQGCDQLEPELHRLAAALGGNPVR
ncbi:motility associated factor glycosyltransferase family protein [Acanthopleuribacter pedis]|uniref:Motility associated factor glycosyltransferase family protein n=1 Tax=Acanthopleuribacter pedis TaxID=442870 RepID=A0A8J7U0Z4_9BACT|nr:6-hydroxymethylpterin diphosphokinase MptE-like protein [Acanthopleuribacter pedis]MBO1317012.1 motility associated factor glycosyltransferase family protein [Acanthopleuribacter pedis]